MLNPVDLQNYNQLLTRFAIERGSGGAFVKDELAVVTTTDTQSYAIPKYDTPLLRQGKMNTSVGPDGKLSERQPTAPDFSTGKCERRGNRGYTLDEIKAQPHGDLFSSEEVEIGEIIDDLNREMELRVKAALDARKSVSGYHASPSVKWDASGFTNVTLVENLEAAARAAELKSGIDLATGKWKVVIPPLVSDVAKAFLRTILKYTDGQFTLGGKVPPALAGMPVVLPGAMKDSANAGQNASIARIWDSDDVYLVYVDPAFASNRRSFTAMAQMRWNGVSPSYAAYRWRCDDPTCRRTHVAADIYDNLETLSVEGIYVVDHVLTVATP